MRRNGQIADCGDSDAADGADEGEAKDMKSNPTLEALLEAARNHEMTPEERREQRISFVYGNLAIDDPTVTKEHVRQVDREMRGER
jgi:hypothetical protein